MKSDRENFFKKQEEIRAQYKGRKLTKAEIDQLKPGLAFMICTCDFGVPCPSFVDPECPLHWDISDGKGGIKVEDE